MTDREKVMQWLETCVSGCEEGCPYEYENLVYRVECKADLMRDALALLKEQEAVEPINSYGTFRCGNCRNIVGYNDGCGRGYQNIFCSKCGKAVKWE